MKVVLQSVVCLSTVGQSGDKGQERSKDFRMLGQSNFVHVSILEVKESCFCCTQKRLGG